MPSTRAISESRTRQFLTDVLDGLGRPQKRLACKYFYDPRGADLFEQICRLEEYYPTRVELEIMRRSAGEMAAWIGQRALLVELGSGSSTKTELLLDHLQRPAGYVPIDVARTSLIAAARRLRGRYGRLPISPRCADFTRLGRLPRLADSADGVTFYFPGSTVGNFEPPAARRLLARLRRVGPPGSRLLLGVDLQKDPAVLHAAYNDASGVTAAFNLNLLARSNRQLGSNFALEQFAHYAFYRPARGRIEMHLVSRRDQAVEVAGRRFDFVVGESILTERSYKHTIEGFGRLAAGAGWRPTRAWTDPRDYFAVLGFEA